MRNAHDDGRSRSHDAAEATTHVRRATPDWVAQVIERGLAHAGESGFEVVGLEVDRADDVLREVAETSLYRPDLDLVVHDSSDSVAAYGLFWYDPATATGLVEPMRTEDDHQRRGLARHILTTGVDLLADSRRERIKICYEPDNPASKHLYLSAGFEPDRQTEVLSGPTSRGVLVGGPVASGDKQPIATRHQRGGAR